MGVKASIDGKNIYSFNYSKKDWDKKKKDLEFKKNLIMPCCKAKAILKTSSLGTQFFSHTKNKDNCDFKPESREHLFLKFEVCRIASLKNWDTQTEVRLEIPSSDEKLEKDYIIADTLLMKDGQQLAIEIQMSSQSDEITDERSRYYKELGIPVVWLMRRSTTKTIKTDYYHVYKVAFDKNTVNVFENYDYTPCTLNKFIRFKLDDTLGNLHTLSKKFNFGKYIDIDDDCVEFSSKHHYVNSDTEFTWGVEGDIKQLHGKIFRDKLDFAYEACYFLSKGFTSRKFTYTHLIKANPNRDRRNLKYLREILKNNQMSSACKNTEHEPASSDNGNINFGNFWDNVVDITPKKG